MKSIAMRMARVGLDNNGEWRVLQIDRDPLPGDLSSGNLPTADAVIDRLAEDGFELTRDTRAEGLYSADLTFVRREPDEVDQWMALAQQSDAQSEPQTQRPAPVATEHMRELARQTVRRAMRGR